MLHRWIAAPLPGGLLDRQTRMRSITIVGTGPFAHGLAVRMLHARCSVTILGDLKSARALADLLGAGARAGSLGSPISGTIVLIALPYPDIEPFIARFGSTLTGKIVVDTSNPIDTSTFDGMLTAPGLSAAECLSALLDGRTPVVKAFNTMSSGVLLDGVASGSPVDVFIASDSDEASASISRLAATAGMNPVDCGPLRRARELEAMMLIVLSLQAHHSASPPGNTFAVKILTKQVATFPPPTSFYPPKPARSSKDARNSRQHTTCGPDTGGLHYFRAKEMS